MLYFILFIFTISISSSKSFIAYDCSGINMNITSVSLINTFDCNHPSTNIKAIDTRIQLVQQPENLYIHAYSCKVHLFREVKYCGQGSHSSAVKNGIVSYVKELGDLACRSIYRTKAYEFAPGKYIDNLMMNSTSYRPLTISGTINVDGYCLGTVYSDFYGTWDTVVVQGSYTITLESFTAVLNIKNNKIILKTGNSCNYLDGYCFDNYLGDTYWDVYPHQDCHSTSMDVLYEGTASKYTDSIDNDLIDGKTNFIVHNNGMLFALRVIKQTIVCGQKIYQTEHPKLFIIENNDSEFFYKKSSTNVMNLDMFTYINSKFVYLERHIKQQMNSMYTDLITQRCQLENYVLQNLLTLAFVNPNDFAYIYMKSPGYTAQVLGEVIHIIKCQPIDVKLRDTDVCFKELPISYDNKSLFMTPKSHLVTSYGTEISCNDLLAPIYYLSGNWFLFSPKRHQTTEPNVFGFVSSSNWSYLDITNLATDGIYTQDELDSLRDHIMYPIEKQSVENIMVRNYMGLNPYIQSKHGSFMLTPYDIDNLTESLSHKIWEYFTNFGTITSGLFGLYVGFLLLKYIINLIFNGLSLYKTFGCSLKLLGLAFSSVTHYLTTHCVSTSNNKQESSHEHEDQIPMNNPSNIVYPSSLNNYNTQLA
jgi:hypothetical protein